MILEICIDSIESALAAKEGGADRLEVCSSLSAGGTTPSIGLVQQCIKLTQLPTMMMIRPHDGCFVYSEHDIETMLLNIESAKTIGASGVVFGCLNSNGSIEINQCRRLLNAAGSLQTTFHRAFDVGRSPRAMLSELIELGFDRVLTSGQAESAEVGRQLIADLVSVASGKVVIMAGAGITPTNARAIMDATGVAELHASASVSKSLDESAGESKSPVQFGLSRRVTSACTVREIRVAMQ